MGTNPVVKQFTRGFNHDRVVGAAAKEILWSLLESCDYSVYPFGYESTFSSIRQRLREKRLENNDLAQRIRSMPDFLVTDSAEQPQLVEINMRIFPGSHAALAKSRISSRIPIGMHS